MFNRKFLPKLIVSATLIFSFQPNFFNLQSLSAHSAANSKSLAIMCGKEKNGKYICFTNEKPSDGHKSKSYKVNSLKEIVDKLNLYGQPTLYEDYSTKKTEIIIWEKPSSSKSLSFAVNLKNPQWWSSLTTYSWWNSSWESSEWSSFYEESTQEYSEEYSEDNHQEVQSEADHEDNNHEEAQPEADHEEDNHEEAQPEADHEEAEPEADHEEAQPEADHEEAQPDDDGGGDD